LARSSAGDLQVTPLARPLEEAAPLFGFVSAYLPGAAAAGWGARAGSGLVGAVLLERDGAAAMLHGPVALGDGGAGDDRAAANEEALALAERLLDAVLAHAPGAGIETLFTRPQGLDRLWVRAGFIPVPEAELPRALRACPGPGLFAWRGGSALWSAAGRAAAAALGVTAEGARPPAGGRGGRRRTAP
jgi:hypothetical protein